MVEKMGGPAWTAPLSNGKNGLLSRSEEMTSLRRASCRLLSWALGDQKPSRRRRSRFHLRGLDFGPPARARSAAQRDLCSLRPCVGGGRPSLHCRASALRRTIASAYLASAPASMARRPFRPSRSGPGIFVPDSRLGLGTQGPWPHPSACADSSDPASSPPGSRMPAPSSTRTPRSAPAWPTRPLIGIEPEHGRLGVAFGAAGQQGEDISHEPSPYLGKRQPRLQRVSIPVAPGQCVATMSRAASGQPRLRFRPFAAARAALDPGLGPRQTGVERRLPIGHFRLIALADLALGLGDQAPWRQRDFSFSRLRHAVCPRLSAAGRRADCAASKVSRDSAGTRRSTAAIPQAPCPAPQQVRSGRKNPASQNTWLVRVSENFWAIWVVMVLLFYSGAPGGRRQAHIRTALPRIVDLS